MAFYELLVNYIYKTQPIENLSIVLALLQMVIQAVSTIIIIYISVQRHNLLERGLLCTVPMIFIITYAFADAFLGGSFLGGGFHDIKGLMQFLRHSSLLKEAMILMIVFPILSLWIGRWSRGLKWWMTVPSMLMSWIMYLVSIWGTARLVFPQFFIGMPQMTRQGILWYIYSLYAVLFQVLLSIMAIVWRIVFREQSKAEDFDKFAYDKDKCKKRIAKLLLRGHRVFLCVLIQLLILLNIILIPEMMENGVTIFYVCIEVSFGLMIVGVGVRVLFPSSLMAMRRMEHWPNASLRQRKFCQEYFHIIHPPYEGDGIILTAHFLVMRSTLRPIILYLPDIHHVNGRREGLELIMKNNEKIQLSGLSDRDMVLLKKNVRIYG